MKAKWKDEEKRVFSVTIEYEVSGSEIGLAAVAQLVEDGIVAVRESDTGSALISAARLLSVEEVFDDTEE
jgi:hypothetical protein